MTTTTATTATRFDAVIAAVVAACADFCAGARQGRDIEARYDELARKSSAELARMGLTRSEIGQAALQGPTRD